MADDPLDSAIDELYGADPDAFMARRTELVAQAKAAGAAAAAKQIGALRKPTRSAYALNRLARTDPDAIDRLRELGEQWRSAEKSVDANQIRALTKSRRRLLDELTRAAFDAVQERNPGAAVREEVVATLTAALSDEAVAQEIQRGALVKPARWEGFSIGGPELTLVAGSGTASEAAPAAQRPARSRPSTGSTAGSRLSPAERREARQAQERAEAQQRAQAEQEAAAAREAALADARQTVDEAEEELILATDDEQAKVDRVHELEQELSDARRAVDEARRQVRRAEIAQRRAHDALHRLERAWT